MILKHSNLAAYPQWRKRTAKLPSTMFSNHIAIIILKLFAHGRIKQINK